MSQDGFINQGLQFPNIDQLKQESRNLFIHEHDFEKELVNNINDIDRYIAIIEKYSKESAFSETDNDLPHVRHYYDSQMEFIKKVKNIKQILLELKTDVDTKVKKIEKQKDLIDSAFERLRYAINEYAVIQNENMKESTKNFNIINVFKRYLREMIKFNIYRKYFDKSGTENEVSFNEHFYHFLLPDDPEDYTTRVVDVIINPTKPEKITDDTLKNHPNMIIPVFDISKIGGIYPPSIIQLSIKGNVFEFEGRMIISNEKIDIMSDYCYNNDSNLSFKVIQRYKDEIESNIFAFEYDTSKVPFLNFIHLSIEAKMIIGSDRYIFKTIYKNDVFDYNLINYNFNNISLIIGM